ncbi:MAG: F0F1 ATP synthase subunit epsilon [Armatimonadetes bacterium]|nr:F0F1 ATP synthase subunit epsilon [Armatimonadota bacterium]
MPEKTFTLEIVTPDRVVMSDDQAVSLVAPGVSGYLGVLANHAPLMTELGIGEITVRRASGEEIHLAETQGFMEVSGNKVTILAESAEKAEEIDVERARAALKRAEDRLARTHEDEVDFARAETAMKRALNRLRVAERGH